MSSVRVHAGERILFIGDSITACMRDRVEPPLGAGYVQLVNCLLAARHPSVPVELVNRGVDGETILDLERRWQQDVLELRPDRVFVMIGVNDVLYRHLEHERRRAVSDEQYREVYRRLLTRTRSALPATIALMDPTPLEEGPGAASHAAMRSLARVVAEVAAEFDAEHVPVFDRVLDAIERAPRRGWMIDVPHPNLKGHAIVALAILEHLAW